MSKLTKISHGIHPNLGELFWPEGMISNKKFFAT